MYDDIINKYSIQYNVPVVLINAVISTESSWDAKAYRAEPKISDASYGLMQLLVKTARSLGYTGTPEGLYDPDTNIHYGTKLLAQIIERVGNVPEAIYSMYNSGSATMYLTSTQVANNVKRFMGYLGSAMTDGSGNPLLMWAIIFMVWAYFRKK